jgi:hypothetical protein
MPIVEKLDEYGKGAWIAFAVLGFILFWRPWPFFSGVDAWVVDMPETGTSTG